MPDYKRYARDFFGAGHSTAKLFIVANFYKPAFYKRLSVRKAEIIYGFLGN